MLQLLYMQFNPKDKSVSLIGDIDFLLFGNSLVFNSEYSLADRTRNINKALDEVVGVLYRADPQYKWDDSTNSDFPFFTRSLVSGKDHYTLLENALLIHRVRVRDSNGSWKTLTPVTRSQLSDSVLEALGTPTSYFKMGGAIFPRPIPNYGGEGSFEVEFQRGSNHFTVESKEVEPGFNSQFHSFLSISAALDYAMANGLKEKAQFLMAMKKDVKDAIREHYEIRSPDARAKITLKARPLRSYGL